MDNELAEATEKHGLLVKEHQEMTEQLGQSQKDMDEVKSALSSLEEEKADREAQEQFNQRMTSLDDKYELTDEDREVIASDIKDLDDEQHNAYVNKLNVLLCDKDKALLAEKAKEEVVTQEEVKASEETDEVVEDVVENAIDNAETEEEAVTNSTSADSDSVYDKYKQAFSVENFEIEAKL